MRLLLIKSLVVIFCSQSFGRELEGEWRVDVERTAWFNSMVMNHSELAIQLLRCIGEGESLRIDSRKIVHVVKGGDCTYKGKKETIRGYGSSYLYRVIYSSDRVTVILKSDPPKGDSVTVIRWVNSDLFWLDEIYDDETQKELRYFFYRK